MTLSRRLFIASGAAALLMARPYQAGAARISAKKGLAGAALAPSGLTTRWYYDWGLQPSWKGVPSGDASIRFIPMCWGWGPHSADTLPALRDQHPAVLFGFNEPDHRDQSNLTVQAALQAWPQLEGIASELVSPSCAQPAEQWMQDFMRGAESRRLRIDAVGFHHYGPPDPDDFIGLLEKVHALYDRPVWVTEFAAADWHAGPGSPNPYTPKQVIDFMQKVCAYMEAAPWVRGYAWYPWGKPERTDPLSASALFGPDGRLTEPGQAYDSL